MPFIPHTDDDIRMMLAALHIESTEALFDEIPASLRCKEPIDIPAGLTEMELSRLMRDKAKQDASMTCFIGAGAYEHHIPAVVWEVASRGEFLTAYTPYQAEASQGTLQLLYEYQTMMASLMGLAVSNASLYDGASALAEAILMAIRSQKRSATHRILVPRTLHPSYRQVVRTIVSQQHIDIVELPIDLTTGRVCYATLQTYADDVTALVIPQPNFFGIIEEVDRLTDWAHEQNALAIAVVNPLAMALLKPPGQWGKQGADIACGEGQPLGIPLASGGPYYGFLCCQKTLLRQMPGRIVGRTVDTEGKEGFVLTLQAREQHIRRGKATSNICTNQGLLVTASTIFMSLMGPTGLKKIATACCQQTRLLRDKLAPIADIEVLFTSPLFHELVLKFQHPVQPILKELAKYHIQAGFSLEEAYPELGHCLLVCVTETKTPADLDHFVEKLQLTVSADASVC